MFLLKSRGINDFQMAIITGLEESVPGCVRVFWPLCATMDIAVLAGGTGSLYVASFILFGFKKVTYFVLGRSVRGCRLFLKKTIQ